MKELVYSKTSQVTPGKDEAKQGKRKLDTASLLGVATGAITAFGLLDKSELKTIAQTVIGVVKVPWLAAGIIAAYVMLGVNSSDEAVE